MFQMRKRRITVSNNKRIIAYDIKLIKEQMYFSKAKLYDQIFDQLLLWPGLLMIWLSLCLARQHLNSGTDFNFTHPVIGLHVPPVVRVLQVEDHWFRYFESLCYLKGTFCENFDIKIIYMYTLMKSQEAPPITLAVVLNLRQTAGR
jgi:hypothetical protein